MNKFFLTGRLTRDVEFSKTSSDTSLCKFTLAVDRNFANKSGEKEVDFIPIVAWRKTAELCEKYLKKGSLVAVSGALQVRDYQDAKGEKRYAFEAVIDEVSFLSNKNNEAPSPLASPNYGAVKTREELTAAPDNEGLPF